MIIQNTAGTIPRGTLGQSASNIAIYGYSAPSGVTAIFVNPSSLVAGTAGNVVSVTGVGTSWTPGTPGSPTFGISSTGAGAAITAQTVLSGTTATLTITAGTVGTITITDPGTGATATISVGASTSAGLDSLLIRGDVYGIGDRGGIHGSFSP